MRVLTWSKLNYRVLCVISTVCEQPALVCHGQQLPCVHCLRSSSFTLTLHSGRSPSSTQQWAGHKTTRRSWTFSLHEIFKCAHLKFTVYGRKQTYIHTTSANAVTLVWGSLRLAPIITSLTTVKILSLLWHKKFWILLRYTTVLAQEIQHGSPELHQTVRYWNLGRY